MQKPYNKVFIPIKVKEPNDLTLIKNILLIDSDVQNNEIFIN